MKYSYLLVRVFAGASLLATVAISQALPAVHPGANGLLSHHKRAIAVQFAPPPPRSDHYDPYASDAPSIGGAVFPAPSSPAIGGGATPTLPPVRPKHGGRGQPFSPGGGITCYPRERACYNRNGYYMPSWTKREFSRRRY